MKIDCHVHLMGIAPSSGGYASKRMRRSPAFKYLFFKMGFHKERDPERQDKLYEEIIARYVRESELDRAVLLAFDEIFDEDGARDKEGTYLHVSNDYVRDVKDRNPALFLFGASVHPYRPDALDELERVREQGAVLVKLLPNSHGFDPSLQRMIPYYRMLAKLEMPLLIHCGYEHTLHVRDQKLGDPRLLRLALDEGVRVIVAHLGSSGRFHIHETFGDFLKLLERYPNCYGDTSALTNFWRSKYLLKILDPQRLNQKYGVQIDDPSARLIHGSDFPIPITPFAFAFRTDRHARRSAKQMNNPLQLDINLKRMVGLSDECLTRGAQVLGLHGQ